MNILMVCLGNICRSPVAEELMRIKMAEYNIPGSVDSAGLLSYHCGKNPDTRAIESAKRKNVDISQQLARQFSKADFQKFDLIFTMDSEVYSEVLRKATSESDRSKVFLFLEYAGMSLKDVPDPYYGGEKEFEYVFSLIDQACDNIARKLLPGGRS
jgi:protein-tyrosine phosphatase